jgi:hypothetical protein
MKKILSLLSLFILLSAFTCENEPLEGEFLSEQEAICLQASQNASDALEDLNNSNDLNYNELCNAYKEALETQISECGDSDGFLQLAIDDLGDCT